MSDNACIRCGNSISSDRKVCSALECGGEPLDDLDAWLRADDDLEAELRAQRPVTRGDCKDGERPCPWVSCRFHLAINMSHSGAEVVLSFPDREIWEIPETCALDVADRSDHTLEEISVMTNVTRERIRQVEARGLVTLRANRKHLV